MVVQALNLSITCESCKIEFLGLQRPFHTANVLTISPIVGHKVNIQLLPVFSLSNMHSGQSHLIINPLPPEALWSKMGWRNGRGLWHSMRMLGIQRT